MKFLTPFIFFILTMVSILCSFVIIFYLRVLLAPITSNSIMPYDSYGALGFITPLTLFGILFYFTLSMFFFFINMLILRLERTTKPRFLNHFRLCFFFYLFVVGIVFNYLVDPAGGDAPGFYLAIFIFFWTSIYAIIVNAVTLFLVNKQLVLVKPRTQGIIFIIALISIMGIIVFIYILISIINSIPVNPPEVKVSPPDLISPPPPSPSQPDEQTIHIGPVTKIGYSFY